jgi:serine/threonine protein kinase
LILGVDGFMTSLSQSCVYAVLAFELMQQLTSSGLTGKSDLRQEVGVLKGLNYDGNIVQFYGACLREGADPMLVTEYMEGERPLR